MKMNKINKMYEKKIEEKLLKINEQILNDSLTNPLLKRAREVPDYYKYWINDSKLVAVIPALDLEDPRSQSYYSVGSLENGDEAQKIRISPVHMYINDSFIDISEGQNNNLNRTFLFDTESSKLYSYEKKKHSKEYHYVKREGFDTLKQYIVDHPVVLFFKGCDDGHVGKRFKTKEEAFEYLQLIDVFEDVFDEELQYHN